MDIDNLEAHYIMSDSDDENQSRVSKLNIRKAKTLSKLEKQRSSLLQEDKNSPGLAPDKALPPIQEDDLAPGLPDDSTKPEKVAANNSFIS